MSAAYISSWDYLSCCLDSSWVGLTKYQGKAKVFHWKWVTLWIIWWLYKSSPTSKKSRKWMENRLTELLLNLMTHCQIRSHCQPYNPNLFSIGFLFIYKYSLWFYYFNYILLIFIDNFETLYFSFKCKNRF